MRAHLLLRGESPQVPTGNYLLACMLAAVVRHVPRQQYADREALLSDYVAELAAARPDACIGVVPEGASDARALLGPVRLIEWLSRHGVQGQGGQQVELVVDSGTGTTAVGLAVGVALLGLEGWRVVGVMLAGGESYYEAQRTQLITAFRDQFGAALGAGMAARLDPENASWKTLLRWVERRRPRRFGKVYPGEVEACRRVAQRYGVLLDPIWTLASWEYCCRGSSHIPLVGDSSSSMASATGRRGIMLGSGVQTNGHEDQELKLVSAVSTFMLHTGASSGALCGIAQRHGSEFSKPVENL
jgi:D-cysteine desulfhydrase